VNGTARTVTGDRPVSELGPVYMHEHLIIDSPLVAAEWPHIHLPSEIEAAAEVGRCAAAGVGAMVDAMPAGAGREVRRLAAVAIETGVSIVATTGMHTTKYYRDVPWADEPADRLAAWFIADIEDGIDTWDYRGATIERTGHRAGIIKVASEGEQLTKRDWRLFEAAVTAARQTGAPILTHTEGGRGGLAQIEAVTGLGFPASRVALSHTDKVDDRGYHREMLSSGAYLCYDQALRWEEENRTAALISEMVAAGFTAQLMVGTDGARRSLWRTLGGSPGLDYLHTAFRDELAGRDVPPSVIDMLFVDNPHRFLTIRSG